MSTSKGRGAAAHGIAEVLPPEQLRFLFLRPRPNQAIEFDPEGTDAIPRLFDEFDRLGAAVAGRDVKGELPPGFERRLPLLPARPGRRRRAEAAARFRFPFAHLATLIQIPGVDVAADGARGEGRARSSDASGGSSKQRIAAARAWLDTYAPDDARIIVQTDAARRRRRARRRGARVPRRARGARDRAGRAAAAPTTATPGRRRSSRPRRRRGLKPGRAFRALYLAFLGRPERAARRLAARQARARLRRRRACARPPRAAHCRHERCRR